MIQAAILAGGLGTRLRPLTKTIPKPMALVRGKPFLDHQLDLLRSFEITHIVLLVSYLGWKIAEYFGDGSRFGLHLDYSYEANPLGTGGALKNAERRLQDNFLLLNGDTFLPIDYRRLVECYQQIGRLGLVVAFTNPKRVVPNNLAVNPQRQVTAYNKRSPAGLTHVDAGAAVFNRRILDLLPSGRPCSLEEEIYPRLIEGHELWALPTEQPFYDIGTFAGLEAATQLFL